MTPDEWDRWRAPGAVAIALHSYKSMRKEAYGLLAEGGPGSAFRAGRRMVYALRNLELAKRYHEMGLRVGADMPPFPGEDPQGSLF